MPIKLRKHNEETYKKIERMFEDVNKVAVIHPTGTGKSFLALKLLEENKAKKAIYVAPSNAILHNIKKNIFDSKMNMTNFPNLQRITYQKLIRLSEEQLHADIIILDEFHHCGAPEWGKGIVRLLENNLNAKVLGLSATPIRYFDKLRDMAEELFGNNIASEMSLEEAIENGILPKAKYVNALYGYNEELDKMKSNIEDIKELEKRQEAQKLFGNLRKKLDENTKNLPSLLSEQMTNKTGKYIVFCKSIEDMREKMKQVQTMFGEVNSNIKTYAVSSKLRENDKILSEFENDKDEKTLKLMFAVNMLNEGYHINDLDGVIMMRPTYSPTIYAQQLGRALTVKGEDGKEPLVIDLVNNFDSIKIIEDLQERLKQYGATGQNKKEDNGKSGISIYDTTKEFREIARKIIELSNRDKITLQEKIEIFERYFKEGNEEINLRTIFEGYPIGQWANQIRYSINQETGKSNLTKSQLEALSVLGILDRRIESTIDEKVDELIEWYEKHPEIKVEKGTISKETKEKLKRLAESKKVDSSEIENQYIKLQKYYKYVLSRYNKLTDEQKNGCQKANLGGIFGFSTEIGELSAKYHIKEEKVYDLCTRFGSVDDFLKMYREGKLTKEEVKKYNDTLMNASIDIDCSPHSKNYLKLVSKVFDGKMNKRENDFNIYSSKNIDEMLEVVLKENYAKVIRARYGLIDGKTKKLKTIGFELGISYARAQQIEQNALKKLRNSSRANKIKPITINDLIKNEFVNDEEKDTLIELEKDMWNSNLIFNHDEVAGEIDFDVTRLSIIHEIREKIADRQYDKIRERIEESRKNKFVMFSREKQIMELKKISIEELILTPGVFEGLHDAGINCLFDLLGYSKEALVEEIKSLGEKKVENIICELGKYGILMNKEGNLTINGEPTNDEEEQISIKDIPIKKLKLSPGVFRGLRNAGITYISDFENYSYEDLLKIESVGKSKAKAIIFKLEKYGFFINKEGVLVINNNEEEENDTQFGNVKKPKDEFEKFATKLNAKIRQVPEQVLTGNK